MEPQNTNPYDFITDSKPEKKSLFGGGSKKQKIIQIAVLFGIITLVGIAALMFVNGSSNKDSNQILQAAATQKDLEEMITSNQSSLRDQKLINESATALTIINSQIFKLNEYMNKHGLKKQSKKIKALQNNQYKQLLEEAKATGKYEETYTALLSNKLDEYRSILKNLYASANNKALRTFTSESHGQLSIIMAKN
jgi:hypothetical protein